MTDRGQSAFKVSDLGVILIMNENRKGSICYGRNYTPKSTKAGWGHNLLG
jgi:hypothetical protein